MKTYIAHSWVYPYPGIVRPSITATTISKMNCQRYYTLVDASYFLVSWIRTEARGPSLYEQVFIDAQEVQTVVYEILFASNCVKLCLVVVKSLVCFATIHSSFSSRAFHITLWIPIIDVSTIANDEDDSFCGAAIWIHPLRSDVAQLQGPRCDFISQWRKEARNHERATRALFSRRLEEFFVSHFLSAWG